MILCSFIFILVDWSKVPAMDDVGFINWLGAALGTSKTINSGDTVSFPVGSLTFTIQ